MNRKLITYLVLLFSSSGFAGENTLVGMWFYDKQLTIDSINSQENIPEGLLSCYEKNRCGSGGARFEFTQDQYRMHIDRILKVTPYRDYKILKSSSDTITIETTDFNDAIQVFTWRINDSIGCRKTDHNGFQFEECYRRQPKPDKPLRTPLL